MKTKLLTICLLLITSQAFGSCVNYVQFLDPVNISGPSIKIPFVSKSNRPMTIHSIQMVAKDKNNTVMKKDDTVFNLGPYGKSYTTMYTGDLNMEFLGGFTFRCKYNNK